MTELPRLQQPGDGLGGIQGAAAADAQDTIETLARARADGAGRPGLAMARREPWMIPSTKPSLFNAARRDWPMRRRGKGVRSGNDQDVSAISDESTSGNV
jgi:hypothetical protein